MLARIVLTIAAATVLAACDPGPNGYGTAPAGVSQEAFDAQVEAERRARREFYRGPRGGTASR